LKPNGTKAAFKRQVHHQLILSQIFDQKPNANISGAALPRPLDVFVSNELQEEL